MVLQYLTVISCHALKPQIPLFELRAKKKSLILVARFFILCMFSIIFAGDNKGSINIDKGVSHSYINSTKTSTIQLEDYLPPIPMSNELWQYLRAGLGYLESSGRNHPPSFVHPGGVAYGSLGLTRIAVIDVIQNYESLSRFTPEDAFTQNVIYEAFAKSYADLLLRHYLGMDYHKMSPQEVFEVLQRAWFLGPGLYKTGVKVLLSREKKAQEYVSKIAKSFQQPIPRQEEIF